MTLEKKPVTNEKMKGFSYYIFQRTPGWLAKHLHDIKYHGEKKRWRPLEDDPVNILIYRVNQLKIQTKNFKCPYLSPLAIQPKTFWRIFLPQCEVLNGTNKNNLEKIDLDTFVDAYGD